MRGIVWAYRMDDGVQYLFEQVVEDYKKIGINATKTQKSLTNSWVQFENGDYWKVVGAGTHARGHRANVSYIDYRIDPECIDTIIKPATVFPPFQAFRYYYPPDKKE